MSYIIRSLSRLGVNRVRNFNYSYSTMVQAEMSTQRTSQALVENQHNIHSPGQCLDEDDRDAEKQRISRNISKREKGEFLVKTLIDLKDRLDNKESVYGALDAWVAWEQSFPIASLKNVIIALEKEEEWHKVVQVIKWMLSKGQGTTMGTYAQLINALDMDNRVDEAHAFWQKKIGIDLHSVSWQLCRRMIAIYYRNNMMENLVKLFEGLEAYDRKPPEKSIVLRVANAYELLGRVTEKERVLEKYKHLFIEDRSPKKSRKASSMIKK
ncbi:pentatricopeptide repeat-containing protein At4g21190 isoform X1 [Cannabis sativa]|uniref:pentatricopeptide repeat-containing protein At4g21190 isoform X1 n=1 Tax=Cannabis sativa TaxID=3483 RepID=UPI0029CA8079|nr:pentatricopeptide repeat-containing protein At4g21190 isoform X1 [Cannabis sativa]XP_030501070.2 pentatricopeptide repeat-containing protein At4g21190 isoform X1 [Cannabis sativa]